MISGKLLPVFVFLNVNFEVVVVESLVALLVGKVLHVVVGHAQQLSELGVVLQPLLCLRRVRVPKVLLIVQHLLGNILTELPAPHRSSFHEAFSCKARGGQLALLHGAKHVFVLRATGCVRGREGVLSVKGIGEPSTLGLGGSV